MECFPVLGHQDRLGIPRTYHPDCLLPLIDDQHVDRQGHPGPFEMEHYHSDIETDGCNLVIPPSDARAIRMSPVPITAGSAQDWAQDVCPIHAARA